MTREEVLAMEPGPQLNDLITHELMGYENDWSGSIAAAWEVVERLPLVKIEFVEIFLGNKRYKVEIPHETGWFEVECRTAPEAICKVALIASIESEETP